MQKEIWKVTRDHTKTTPQYRDHTKLRKGEVVAGATPKLHIESPRHTQTKALHKAQREVTPWHQYWEENPQEEVDSTVFWIWRKPRYAQIRLRESDLAWDHQVCVQRRCGSPPHHIDLQPTPITRMPENREGGLSEVASVSVAQPAPEAGQARAKPRRACSGA